MFQQTFIESEDRKVKVWSLAASLVLQGCVLGLSVLLPLVFTYDLPVADWMRRSLLLEPPPPPIMRAEQKVPAPAARARFEAALSFPQAIPENAVMINDAQSALTTFAAPDIGVAGGIGGDGAGSVFGDPCAFLHRALQERRGHATRF